MADTENKQVSPKDIYHLMWSCRNLEIDNLWKRSTLLATFLVIFWTGLGYTFYKFIDLCVNTESTFRLASPIGNFFLTGIQIYCVLGSFISLLWICMMKGSKAWVENFEAHIDSMVENEEYRKMIFSSEVAEKLGKDEHFPYNGAKPYVLWQEWNNSIFSPKGGCFSPSRINVVIGIVSFILFSIVEYFMFVMVLLNACSVMIPIFAVLILLSYFGFNYLIYKSVESGFLKDVVKNQQEKNS